MALQTKAGNTTLQWRNSSRGQAKKNKKQQQQKINKQTNKKNKEREDIPFSIPSTNLADRSSEKSQKDSTYGN